MIENDISPEQPGRADPGKDVEIADAEHQFRASVDDPRPGTRRLAERERQRLARRFARCRMNFLPIGLTHPPRYGANVRRPRLHDLRSRRHPPTTTLGMMARMVIGSGSNCFTNMRPFVFQSQSGVIVMSPV